MARGVDQILTVLMPFFEIGYLMRLKEPVDKIWMLWTLLKGQALSYFEHHFRRGWKQKIQRSLKMTS
jgi:hypothetical protein